MASDEADNEVFPYEQLEEERISLKGQLANLRGRCADLEEERVSAVNFSRASTEVISHIAISEQDGGGSGGKLNIS
jgi:hypothetical protein